MLISTSYCACLQESVLQSLLAARVAHAAFRFALLAMFAPVLKLATVKLAESLKLVLVWNSQTVSSTGTHAAISGPAVVLLTVTVTEVSTAVLLLASPEAR